MDRKTEEARPEFNEVVDFIVGAALGRQIHEVEEDLYRRLLRLGRILLELFILASGTGKTGATLIREDGTVFGYLSVSRVVRTSPSSERSLSCGPTMPSKGRRGSSR